MKPTLTATAPVSLRRGLGLALQRAQLQPARDDPVPTVELRIETGVSGHIHPAICISKKGTLVAVYCKSEYQPYLIQTIEEDFDMHYSPDTGGTRVLPSAGE